jgi:hypothetical protein
MFLCFVLYYSCGQVEHTNLVSWSGVLLAVRFFQMLTQIVNKHTSEVFPMMFWAWPEFWTKNSNIWCEKQVEISQKSPEVGTCVRVQLEANQKRQRMYQKGISLHLQSLVADW